MYWVPVLAGIACLELIAGEPIIERADAAAERLKLGLRDALSRREVPGHVHGIASVVHVLLGVECDCGGDICTLSHSEIARVTGAQAEHGGLSGPLKLAMLNEGVDMMGGIGFMLSAVHRDEDVDRTAEAFERSLAALRDEGLV
jgi:glutamate-1-semialdehyde aminotransferase